MLTKQEFKKRFVKCCKKELLDRGVEGMEIIPRQVNKAQRGVLNGLIFKPKDSYCAPTFYIEQFYPLYLEGRSVASLSRDAVEAVIDSLGMAAFLGSDICDPAKSPEDLTIRLLNISRNREYLKSIPHLELSCGFALIAEMVSGEYRAVINNELLELLELSKDELFERALQNSVTKKPAVLWRLSDASRIESDSCENLLDMHTKSGESCRSLASCSCQDADSCSSREPAEADVTMYVLSNEKTFWGAAALFYPGVIDKIHELLGGDFYILPSSVHELIVLPLGDVDPEILKAMIRDANETVVNCEDVLSDDLYVCRSGEVSRFTSDLRLPAALGNGSAAAYSAQC